MPVNTIDDFWKRIHCNEDEDECWLWLGGKDKDGYGRFKLAGVKWVAHRLAYFTTYDDLEPGEVVCHACDNPPCCNPKHLFTGDRSKNRADCVSKGRQARGDHVPPEKRGRGETHWTKRKPERLARGERQWKARLTPEIAVEIYRRYHAGGIGQRQLAREYSINSSSVNKIVHGLIWKEALEAVRSKDSPEFESGQVSPENDFRCDEAIEREIARKYGDVSSKRD